MESIAAGCVPLLTKVDAFPELWSVHGVPSASLEDVLAIPKNAKPEDSEYVSLALSLLLDNKYYLEVQHEIFEYAERFRYDDLVKPLEQFLRTRGKDGLPNAHVEGPVIWDDVTK